MYGSGAASAVCSERLSRCSQTIGVSHSLFKKTYVLPSHGGVPIAVRERGGIPHIRRMYEPSHQSPFRSGLPGTEIVLLPCGLGHLAKHSKWSPLSQPSTPVFDPGNV